MTIEVKPEILHNQVLQALRERAFDNVALLQPGQLQEIAQALVQVAMLDTVAASDLGAQLNQRGLALSSLLHASTALLNSLFEQQDGASAFLAPFQRLATVIQSFHSTELNRLRSEQSQMQEAIRTALSEREQRTDAMLATIQELSTPIVPIHQGILVVPLIGTIDSARSTEITQRLLESIGRYRASEVIIDITGVPVIDTSIAEHLLRTAEAAGLLGTEVLLVGINAEIAQTLVQLGVNLQGITTLSDLEQGVAYALRRRGLAIQPVRGEKVSL